MLSTCNFYHLILEQRCQNCKLEKRKHQKMVLGKLYIHMYKYKIRHIISHFEVLNKNGPHKFICLCFCHSLWNFWGSIRKYDLISVTFEISKVCAIPNSLSLPCAYGADVISGTFQCHSYLHACLLPCTLYPLQATPPINCFSFKCCLYSNRKATKRLVPGMEYCDRYTKLWKTLGLWTRKTVECCSKNHLQREMLQSAKLEELHPLTSDIEFQDLECGLLCSVLLWSSISLLCLLSSLVGKVIYSLCHCTLEELIYFLILQSITVQRLY